MFLFLLYLYMYFFRNRDPPESFKRSSVNLLFQVIGRVRFSSEKVHGDWSGKPQAIWKWAGEQSHG